MDPELQKKFAKAIEQGIRKTLEEHPGIEKELDWFSIRAQHENK